LRIDLASLKKNTKTIRYIIIWTTYPLIYLQTCGFLGKKSRGMSSKGEDEEYDDIYRLSKKSLLNKYEVNLILN